MFRGFQTTFLHLHSVSGRSPFAKALLFLLMAYAFLWVPDLDLVFVDVLHHRSIVTHSILPALGFILVGTRAGAAPAAGALLGLAVHLSCDMLSPMVGFAQIWLPAPFKTPLGSLSYLWLFANGFLAFWLARVVAIRTFNWRQGHLLMGGTGVLTALSYGWVNEGSLGAVIATLSMFALSLLGPVPKALRNAEAKGGGTAGGDHVARKVGTAVLRRALDVVDRVNHSLTNINESMEGKTLFLQQRWIIKAALDVAQSELRTQAELSANPDLAAIHTELLRDWDAGEPPPRETLQKTHIDLLQPRPPAPHPKQEARLQELEREHRALFQATKAAVLGDPKLMKAVSSYMAQNGHSALLAQILNFDDGPR